MVHSSNPRLMNRVLDAVAHLCDGKGSRAREVIDFLRQTSKSPPRNLTMQVHRALKHAVSAGLLRHRSGRYKALFTLNPAPVKQSAIEEKNETSIDAAGLFTGKQTTPKTKTDDDDIELADDDAEDHGRHRRERKRKRSRSRNRPGRRKGRSGSRKPNNTFKQRSRKKKKKEKGESSRTVKDKISNSRLAMGIGHASKSTKRKRNSGKFRDDQSYYSDPSESDYESRKTKVRRKTPAYQESKHNGGEKPSRRSTSRSRSSQRQPVQQLHLKYSYDDVTSDKQNADDESRNDGTHQDEEKRQEPNDSGSGSSL